jgi:hypothetical protein
MGSRVIVQKTTRCAFCWLLALYLQVHQAVTSGGKVLIPVFAVGRAQELLLLLDELWERTQLQVGCVSPQPNTNVLLQVLYGLQMCGT